jgi:hypothetical protein
MKNLRNYWISASLLLGLTPSALADPIPLPPELKAFLERPDQKQAVNYYITRQWQAAVSGCATPKMTALNAIVESPPAYDSGGAPISGQWRLIGRVEGCGQNRLLNIEYLFGPDGKMRMIGMVPGTSTADLRLQRDAAMYASIGMAKLKPRDCKETNYSDTGFIKYEDATPNSNGGRPWAEEWRVQTCDVTGIVTLHFTPGAAGTLIRVEVNETRQVNP